MIRPLVPRSGADLTLPRRRRGPLPLPPAGRRGAFHLLLSEVIPLAPRLRGERVGVRGKPQALIGGLAHLTLPPLPRRVPPSPP